MRRPLARSRRGMALLDAIIGGIILSIGLGATMSITARALSSQNNGERQLVAAWLADELLSMVVVEGPVAYPQLYDTSGTFDEPFDDFVYEVEIDERGAGEPYGVIARIGWGTEQSISVETLVMLRQGDPTVQVREPFEPLDREGRYLEMEAEDEDGI